MPRCHSAPPAGAALQDLRYAYDAVGNVSALRDVARQITGTPSVTFTDPLNTFDTNYWQKGPNAANISIASDGGNNVVQLLGDGATWNTWISSTHRLQGSGAGMQVRFKTGAGGGSFVLGLVDDTPGAYYRFTLYGDTTGHLRMQYYDGSVPNMRYPVLLTPALQTNTWYTLTLRVDDVRGHTLDVYTDTQGTHYGYNLYFAAGRSWHMQAWVTSGTLWLDDYREFNGGAVVVPDDKQAFQYDALDRLTRVISSTTQGYSGTYAYNAIGNLTSKDEGAGSVTYEYPAAGQPRPHAVINSMFGGTGCIYVYDANGNMGGSCERGTYSWDVDNRLAQVVTGTLTTQFGYDADGRRVLQTLPDGTKIAYVGGIEVSITGTARITKTYYSAGAKLVAMRVTTATGSALYFVHTDHLGSVSLTSDSSGAVVSVQKYTAWGVVRAATGAAQTDIGYTGQRLDATGLMYYQARYFDASLARFVSADSLVPSASNPQALNRYSYAFGNPLNYTDPSGHCPRGDAEEAQECRWLEKLIKDAYGISVNPGFTQEQLEQLHYGLMYVAASMGGDNVFRSIWGGTSIVLWDNGEAAVAARACAVASSCQNRKNINLTVADLRNRTPEVLAHELGHLWDYLTPQDGRAGTHYGLAREMAKVTGGYWCNNRITCAEGGGEHTEWALSSSYPGSTSSYARSSTWEDFATAFALWVTNAPNSEISRSYSSVEWSMRRDIVMSRVQWARLGSAFRR